MRGNQYWNTPINRCGWDAPRCSINGDALGTFYAWWWDHRSMAWGPTFMEWVNDPRSPKFRLDLDKKYLCVAFCFVSVA
ncbi:hypothetical protein BHE74_00007430 [Ensete ventricosum]|nr:hypothetical protein GW17_00009225 [Ensete ventricosum]RWW84007.1 hypothetical protein BHE74_00007430 [Ensete ventricosum]RZR89564.1 hypothetical protein BHM03_00017317 [Ensete ventricosum]